MPRQSIHAGAAERQRAYRTRQASRKAQKRDNVTQAPIPLEIVTTPQAAPLVQPSSHVAPPVVIPSGTLCRHAETPGLIVRVQHALERNRVMALVQQPGAGNLKPGQAYPFKVVNLEEVTG